MAPVFHQHSTGEEVAKAFPSRVEGKTFVITGTSAGGIGAATAVALAHGKPKTLFLTGRTQSKTESVIAEINKISPTTKTVFVELDLTDQDAIRRAAKSVLDSGHAEVIHGLINNAGVMATPYGKTQQGIEVQFGTNHIGHFLWTKLLLPRVLAAGPNGRVVNLGSMAYVMGDVNLDDITWSDGKTYHPWRAYGSSKTAVILFNVYLSEQLKGKGVQTFAVQPGMPQTRLYTHTQDPDSKSSFAEAYNVIQEIWAGKENPSGDATEDEKTLETAASTIVYAALSPDLDDKSGTFLRNCKPFTLAPYATDLKNAERLWKLSEELVGEEFDI
ncbi:short-chain dehydrogenase [Leptodontidium sp. MPI-SDFR-AT-0119]|nr:short-chain dehydrogenase [Leptodontidium sp. MPI-SDFR-AT-0119]